MGVVGRRVVLLALLVTAASLWPASAMAATGSLVNGVMNYTADNNESNAIVFTLDNDGFEDVYKLVDAPAVAITAIPPCQQPGPANEMECPVDGNGSGAITLLTASLGDGNDTITLLA